MQGARRRQGTRNSTSAQHAEKTHRRRYGLVLLLPATRDPRPPATKSLLQMFLDDSFSIFQVMPQRVLRSIRVTPNQSFGNRTVSFGERSMASKTVLTQCDEHAHFSLHIVEQAM